MGICAKQTTIAIITNGNKFWVGTNECKNPQDKCPRKGMKTGEGYELCKQICKQEFHAEVNACMKAGIGAKGATLYLIGHYYCCEGCKRVMDEFGIAEVIICDS